MGFVGQDKIEDQHRKSRQFELISADLAQIQPADTRDVII
jgi:hypothetical protein